MGWLRCVIPIHAYSVYWSDKDINKSIISNIYHLFLLGIVMILSSNYLEIYNKALLTRHPTMLQSMRTYFSYLTAFWYPLSNLSLSPSPPIILYFYEISIF
jgi:hypothetical protein